MAVTPRILRVSLTTAEPERLAAFYVDALGFTQVAVEERSGAAFSRLMGIDAARARAATLRLGRQEVELLAFAGPGAPYPSDSASSDLRFQHLAIVVRDMRSAYARLAASRGWTPITRPEPQQLPARSGGVLAFKFRDPEGHPLELLEFPRDRTPAAWRTADAADPCLGVDHSAITVADSARSVDFYRRLFGFSVAARSLNRGPEQARLDGVPAAVVEVTALGHPAAGPLHLELLCYRPPATQQRPQLNSSDIAATRLVIEVDDLPTLAERIESAPADFVSRGVVVQADGRPAALLRDPDGHASYLLS